MPELMKPSELPCARSRKTPEPRASARAGSAGPITYQSPERKRRVARFVRRKPVEPSRYAIDTMTCAQGRLTHLHRDTERSGSYFPLLSCGRRLTFLLSMDRDESCPIIW